MYAIQITKLSTTRVDFQRNLNRFKEDINTASAKDRVIVLEINEEAFYVVCKYPQDIEWSKAVLNFHYVNSVEILDVVWL